MPFRTDITHTLNEETEDPKNSRLSANSSHARNADTSRLRSHGTERIFDGLKIRTIRCSVHGTTLAVRKIVT